MAPAAISPLVLGAGYEGQNCSAARALEVVGERWSLLIVRDLLYGARHFSQLERTLGVAKNVLAARLQKLVEAGVVIKAPAESERPGSYALTAKGRDLHLVLIALTTWGDQHCAPKGPPLRLEHTCGGSGVRLSCSACGEPVEARDVRLSPGPGYDATARNAVIPEAARPGRRKREG